MELTPKNLSLILHSELQARRMRNPAFSMRRFAKQLGLSPATMSQVLSGKRPISRKMTAKVVDALNLPEFSEFRSDDLKSYDAKFIQLASDRIEMIGNWYYHAILSMADLPNTPADPKVISGRLGITILQAQTAIERLHRLGMIEIQKNYLKPKMQHTTTTYDVPNAAIRNMQRQFLDKAGDSLQLDPVDVRDISNIVMAVDPARLPAAKALIADFRRQIAKYLESGKPSQVYNLSIQLFPLERNHHAQ